MSFIDELNKDEKQLVGSLLRWVDKPILEEQKEKMFLDLSPEEQKERTLEFLAKHPNLIENARRSYDI